MTPGQLRPPTPFVTAVLGTLTVVLVHNPSASIPRAPYVPWLMLAGAVGLLGVLCQLGLEDALHDIDEIDALSARAIRWRAAGLAYLLGVVASVTYLASAALIERLDAVF